MVTTFFTDEYKERFYTACNQLQAVQEEFNALHAKAEEEQNLELAKGNECEVLNDFVEQLGNVTDSLNDADNSLYWVSMEDEEDEEE